MAGDGYYDLAARWARQAGRPTNSPQIIGRQMDESARLQDRANAANTDPAVIRAADRINNR